LSGIWSQKELKKLDIGSDICLPDTYSLGITRIRYLLDNWIHYILVVRTEAVRTTLHILVRKMVPI
jgi:hypothetical protein